MSSTGLVYDTALGVLSGDELLAFVEEEGEAKDEETVNPVLPTGGDIIYAAIFFFGLWAAMKYVLLPPIQKVRAERAARIAAARDAADHATADMGSAQADYDAALADARAEAASILEAARSEADAHRAEVVGAAESEAAELRATAEAEVAQARADALGNLTGDVAEVAAGAASTVIGRQVDVAATRQLVEQSFSGGGA